MVVVLTFASSGAIVRLGGGLAISITSVMGTAEAEAHLYCRQEGW